MEAVLRGWTGLWVIVMGKLILGTPTPRRGTNPRGHGMFGGFAKLCHKAHPKRIAVKGLVRYTMC